MLLVLSRIGEKPQTFQKNIIKMKSRKIKLLVIIISFLGISSLASAQKNYALDSKSTFSVSGTSTLHDWEMKSGSGTGTANLAIVNSKLTEIESLSVTLL